MDYFQGVVTDYLVANRCTFVNSELLIQLDEGKRLKGRHWYCDAAAVSFADDTLYLCEVTYSKTMTGLGNRLLDWNNHWVDVKKAIHRDFKIPGTWTIQPWAFIPEQYIEVLEKRLKKLPAVPGVGFMPYPKITSLEAVVPWKYDVEDR